MNAQDEIRSLLQTFQAGYTCRDLSQVDTFMELFTADVEVIGTNGSKPAVGEWYTSRQAARALVYGDWESWGDLLLDLDSASIHVQGDAGWVAASATVCQRIGEENYTAYLEFVQQYIQSSPLPARQKLHYILRGGTNTLYELERGEQFTWLLRFTAVVVREGGAWKFTQVHFSYPTIYFPDVRVIP